MAQPTNLTQREIARNQFVAVGVILGVILAVVGLGVWFGEARPAAPACLAVEA